MVVMSIRARHTVSGQIAEVHEDIFNHDVLGKYLERVDEDAKPYLPEMHKPAEADKVPAERKIVVPDETHDNTKDKS